MASSDIRLNNGGFLSPSLSLGTLWPLNEWKGLTNLRLMQHGSQSRSPHSFRTKYRLVMTGVIFLGKNACALLYIFPVYWSPLQIVNLVRCIHA